MRIKLSYILALALAIGIGYWMSSGEVVIGGIGDGPDAVPAPAERTQSAAVDVFKVEVQTIRAEERNALLEVRGTTEAEAKISVRAETADTIISRPAVEGARVARGDILCVLNTGAREARILEAKAALEQARIDHQAAEKLSTRGFTAQNNVVAQKARLDAAQARLEEAQIERNRIVIKSPIDGIVQSPMANVGDRLDMGGVCATVVNSDPMIAVGQVSEANIGLLSIGMAGSVKLIDGTMLTGTIRYIAPAADPDTRTFRIEVEMPNADGRAKDGMTALTMIELPAGKAHRISPAILTLDDSGRVGVQSVDEGNKSRFMPVELLGGDKGGVWVAGLPDTVTIITVGQEYITDGQAVEPVVKTAEVTQ